MKASLILLALALTGVGSACSSTEPEARSPEDVVATEHPGRLEPTSPGEEQLLARLDTLKPEEALTVDGSQVTAEASYWSASGNECRRASFVSSTERRERLACRDEQGWFFVPDVFGGAP